MARMVSARALDPRDPQKKQDDIQAVRAIAQAAVDVELFTIPLYMTSLYSISGMHEINSKGNSLYKGWYWPGATPQAEPKDATERAFNIIYSIFVEEMLHLQMAANIASAIGAKPRFTGMPLQNPAFGWICYGEHVRTVPHIIDLTDTKHDDLPVNTGPLDKTRLRLFTAIEEREEDAFKAIRPEARKKYFAPAPFADDVWKPGQPLPWFGTIGHMYQCYHDYLHIRYTDGTTLWDAVRDPKAVQRDYFNAKGKPRQYDFDLALDLGDPDAAFSHLCKMMDAITDQGEGSTLKPLPAPNRLQAVKKEFRANKANLDALYPSYDSDGNRLAESAKANARCERDGRDHFERFEEIAKLLPKVKTWPKAKKAGRWTAQDFIPRAATGDAAAAAAAEPGSAAENPYGLPTHEELAHAWNSMAARENKDKYWEILNTAVIGAIAGMTGVLNDYWSGKTDTFPSPAMGGTGDRMATLWAALGTAPDLARGIGKLADGLLGHSCQGLDFNVSGDNDCAAPETFHSCIGSNNCHAEGGCGFVNDGSGRSCGGSAPPPPPPPGTKTVYSAPGDNKCGGFGGCAVPISASQLYPKPTEDDPGSEWTMEVYDFVEGPPGKWTSKQVDTLTYKEGDKVADVAYRAFAAVMKSRNPDEKPRGQQPPNLLRLVFPPST